VLIEFPSRLVVGSAEHRKIYGLPSPAPVSASVLCADHEAESSSASASAPVPPTGDAGHAVSEPLTNVYFAVSEIEELKLSPLLQLLYVVGVGVYAAGLPAPYLTLVLKQINSGRLRVCLCDQSAAYGLNLQVQALLIDDSLGNQVASATLFQLIGRVGRLGLTDTAHLRVGPLTAQRMLTIFRGADLLSTGPATHQQEFPDELVVEEAEERAQVKTLIF
jgi:hypothetical protein